LIPLVVLGPHGNSADVFKLFLNGGGWPTQGISFFVGLLGNVFAFFGADGAYHVGSPTSTNSQESWLMQSRCQKKYTIRPS